MFVKNNILYSDAYKYLKHKTKPIVGMLIPLNNFTEDDFEEINMTSPLDIVVKDKSIYWQRSLFFVTPKLLTYADIKTAIIKSRYSDDDQMALILNRESSEENEVLYQKMQQWREFAGYVANVVVNKS